jgi:hypothetical protein
MSMSLATIDLGLAMVEPFMLEAAELVVGHAGTLRCGIRSARR